MGFLATIFIGILAGWIAGKIMNTEHGIILNLILGLIGGSVGAMVLKAFGITGSGFIGSLFVSIFGTCILIFIARLIK